ncbi:tandem-95 repeat protein, partial [Pedobacter sp. HMF7647]
LTSQPIVGSNQGPLNATQTSLHAEQPAVGTGEWSQQSGPSNAVYNANDRNTTVSSLIPGTYVFTWTITGFCGPTSKDVTIIINATPSTSTGNTSTTEDTPVPGDLKQNTNDPDGDPLTFTTDTPPTHGTVTIDPDGSYTYTPDPNYNGPDQFTYQVCDDHSACTTGTIVINVTPVNDPPIANNGTNRTNEDTPVTGTLTPGNSDPDGDPLTYTTGSPPTHGTVDIHPDGSYTYTPDPNYHGPDEFTYNVCDNNGACTPATVIIDVTPVNDPPIISDGSNTTPEDTPVRGDLTPGTSDPDGDPLIYTEVTPPTHGTVVINPDGSYTYTPDSDYNGPDQFTYNVCDNNGACTPATVIITVTPVNDPPVANTGTNTTNEDTQVPGSLNPITSDPDGDPLTYTKVTDGDHGTVVINPDGTYVYTPNPDYYGTDQFEYKVCDGNVCSTSTITITVDPVAIVSLTPAVSTVLEGFKTSVYARLDKPVKNDVLVRLSYTGDAVSEFTDNRQGASNPDYQLQDNHETILIPKGKIISTQKLTVYAIADNIKEPDESVFASIDQVITASTVNIGSGAQVIIKDVTPDKPAVVEENNNPDILPDPYLSPNGDGQGNEVFTVRNINKYPDNEVLIYNRWGNLVFKLKNYDNDINSFKGRANTGILTNTNDELIDGVYYYIIYTKTGNSDRKMNKGYIILKRKEG